MALEWGGLASASIFNEIDIYFSPSWLPPHRSLSHPPALFSSPWRQGCGAGASQCWEPPAPPKSCSWGAGPLLGLGGTRGEAGGGRGSPVPSRGVTCILPIPWGHGHGPAGASLRNLLVLGAGGCVHAVLGAGWGPFGSIPPPPNLCPPARGWARSPRCSGDRRAFGEGAGGQKEFLGVSPCWRCDRAQLRLLDEQEAVGLPHKQAQGITLTHGAPAVPIAWGQRWWGN